MYYNCVTTSDNKMCKDELMSKIQSYSFAINDLTLYLDTHPSDEKAVTLHNEYTKQYKKYYDDYERKFGPLSIFCPCNSWRWLGNPWPWEGGNQ